MTKPKVGIFSLTCCEGCQIEILDLEDILLDIADAIDIVSFRLAREQNMNAKFDIGILEGSISTQEDLERTQEIRERSKILVALGSCACTGGIQALKHFQNKKQVEAAQFHGRKIDMTSLDAKPITSAVQVDYFVRGCPIDRKEFVEVLKQLLLSVKPYQREWPVCVECRIKENPCLLEHGKICLGPVTYSGCDAVCTSNKLQCIGCRGIMHDANIESYVEMLKKKKHKMPKIKEAFQTMYGPNERLKEVK